MALAPIEDVIEDIRQGKMVILVDDEDRENEGDLTMAAELVTPEAINFMARYGRGLICLALAPDFIDRLQLKPMVRDNQSRFQTAFTRFHRGQAGGHHRHFGGGPGHHHPHGSGGRGPARRPGEPGPYFPAPGQKGRGSGAHRPDRGVRGPGPPGRAEIGAAVICEVMNDDGTMARMPDLEKFAVSP